MTDRLLELAKAGARDAHVTAAPMNEFLTANGVHVFTDDEATDYGFAVCPHPDCVLVRGGSAPAPASEVEAELNSLRTDADWRHRWHDRLGRGSAETEGKFYARLEAAEAESVARIAQLRTALESLPIAGELHAGVMRPVVLRDDIQKLVDALLTPAAPRKGQ